MKHLSIMKLQEQFQSSQEIRKEFGTLYDYSLYICGGDYGQFKESIATIHIILNKEIIIAPYEPVHSYNDKGETVHNTICNYVAEKVKSDEYSSHFDFAISIGKQEGAKAYDVAIAAILRCVDISDEEIFTYLEHKGFNLKFSSNEQD